MSQEKGYRLTKIPRRCHQVVEEWLYHMHRRGKKTNHFSVVGKNVEMLVGDRAILAIKDEDHPASNSPVHSGIRRILYITTSTRFILIITSCCSYSTADHFIYVFHLHQIPILVFVAVLKYTIQTILLSRYANPWISSRSVCSMSNVSSSMQLGKFLTDLPAALISSSEQNAFLHIHSHGNLCPPYHNYLSSNRS